MKKNYYLVNFDPIAPCKEVLKLKYSKRYDVYYDKNGAVYDSHKVKIKYDYQFFFNTEKEARLFLDGAVAHHKIVVTKINALFEEGRDE